jgi:hypothetical protein
MKNPYRVSAARIGARVQSKRNKNKAFGRKYHGTGAIEIF